ncbi:MAG TPA: ABC-2 family transporter protein [Bacillota bacterium]|nr:ABC-2 family transporter protein [Bacillota bacterium]
MRAYVEFARKSFQNNLVYRVDYLVGVLNTVISIFVYIAVWKAIYGTRAEIGGISFRMVATNFVLGLGIANLFNFDYKIISQKVKDGTIAMDLLKPVDFNGYILAKTIGNVCFNTLVQFLPALILAVIFIGILPPHSWLALGWFGLSLIFSFLLLYHLNYIISIASFWFYNIWSLATLKDVVVSILSGTLIPMWFMPEALAGLIKLTPFDSLFFVPVSIYLGRITAGGLLWALGKQLIWCSVLFGFSQLLWKAATKRLIVEGG